MNNPPSSVAINVTELETSELSESLKQFNLNSAPSSSSSPAAVRKPSRSRHSPAATVGRRLPDASNLSPSKCNSHLSASNSLSVRRYSSTNIGDLEGRPRRSLPSPGVLSSSAAIGGTSWHHQQHCAYDEEFSEGYKSREDSPVRQLQQARGNGGSTGNVTVLSSPTRDLHSWRPMKHRRSQVLRPYAATSAMSLAQPERKSTHERVLTPTLIFSLSSGDSFPDGNDGKVD